MCNRIRELSKAATRGWPGKRVHTRGEAYNLVGLQKNVSQEMLCKKEEGKGYLIKKRNDIRYVIRCYSSQWLTVSVRIMIFAMLFVTVVNRKCTYYDIRYVIRSVWQIFQKIFLGS